MILHKEMKKMYRSKYQHKIVLVLQGAHLFRNRTLEDTLSLFYYFRDEPDAYPNVKPFECDIAFSLIDTLKNIEDYAIRVERCYLSIYLTEKKHVNWIKKAASVAVREIYTPKVNLSEGVIVSTLPYDYKVNIKVNRSVDYGSFIQWATDNKNVRLPDSALAALLYKSPLYQHVYFYITGDKHLTLAKMHLGTGIKTVDRLINP